MKKLTRSLIFILPLLFATAGLMLDGKSLLDAMFAGVTMYTLNYGDGAPNALTEIGRWSAPLVSAYSVVSLASSLKKRFSNFLRSFRDSSVAVYGPKEEKERLLSQFPDRGVSGTDKVERCQSHVLLWEEEENFRFYEANKNAFAGKTVYIKSASLPSQSAADPKLRLFCPEETAARLFWKNASLYELSCSHSHHMSIVMIGFSRLGNALLTQALQHNIFSPDQEIAYHIFGPDSSYLSLHHELSRMEDRIVFHPGPWQEETELLEDAAMVIVLGQEDQLSLLSGMLLCLRRDPIHVFCKNTAGIDLLSGKERLRCFCWQEEACRPENILGEKLYERAMAINLLYAHLYSGTEETPENAAAEWEKLDTFTRYSNISSADYHEVRLFMLNVMGLSGSYREFPEETKELLAELEHMRWCRYHWLNNWTYGEPADKKNKDRKQRIHTDLLPYRDLSEKEKQKDRDTVEVLMEL